MISSLQIMGIDSSHIVAVNEHHSLHGEVKDAFCQMQADAAIEGLDLQICSSFRSFDKQLSIWNRKWRGELALYTIDGEILDANTLTDEEKIHAILTWSALPGASRHHWGTDFDFYDKRNVEKLGHVFELIPQEYENEGPCAELARWVHTHCDSYGFYLPYQHYTGGVAREPWHLSHKAIAQQIQSHFSADTLAEQLAKSEMLGKQSVLSCLPELIRRYTYNEGVKA
jgi:LAS superfamily LD-carboxypeptidase LdcB